MIAVVAAFALIGGTGLSLGLLADYTNIGAGLAAFVRGASPPKGRSRDPHRHVPRSLLHHG